MKALHMVTFILVIVGAINWGLTALGYNLVETIFGMGSGLTNLIYLAVGVSGVYLIFTHKGDCKICGKK